MTPEMLAVAAIKYRRAQDDLDASRDLLAQAVRDAIAESGAAGPQDMGKVMAVLKAKYAATLDMAKAGPLVKAKLGG